MTKDAFNISSTGLNALLPDVSAIAREAGRQIMQFYNGKAGALNVQIKDDASPVTAADQTASDYIVNCLNQLTPGVAVVSEENAVEPPAGGLYWTIDPLDGTKEFLGRTGGFAVKIALMDDNRPALGAVYAPVFQTLYTATRDSDALRQTGSYSSVVLHTRLSSPGRLTTLFNQTHADPGLYQRQRAELMQKGLALPLSPMIMPGLPRNLQVAEGLADLHVNTGDDPTLQGGGGYSWDNAPDCLMLERAGGRMVSLTDGQTLTFAPDRARMPAYIAFGDPALARRFFPE